MTLIRQQAMQMIHAVPEDKMVYVINILKNLQGLFNEDVAESVEINERAKAWDELQKYRGSITDDIDYKSELAAARDEKYAYFN